MKYNVEWSTNNTDWTVLVEGIVEQAVGSPLVQRNSWAHYSNQLTPGSTFYYRIIAINTSDEKSQPSVVGSAVAIARSGTGIVTSIRATRQSNTSIQVAWNAPTDLPTGVTTSGYIVFRSENQGDSWIPRQSTLNLVTGTLYTDTGLKTNTCYGFRALHIASNFSISHLSDEAYATTGTVTTPAKPTGLSATGDGASTFNISWTAPASNKCAPILGYHIQERANSGADWGDVVQDTFDDAVTYAHTGQTLTMSRQYRVRAENSAGWGAWSDVFTTQAPPGAPTGVIVTSTRANHTLIIWTAPTNRGSSAITSYTMEWSTDDTNWSVLATGIPVANNLVYNHYSRLLTVGDRFHYRVRAVNSAGTGPPSTSSSTLVVANSLTTGVPTGVTVSQTGAAQITVSWTAPTNLPSNDPVRSYVVFRTTNGGDSWALLSETVPPTTLTYADNSLTSGITYGYTVAVIVETSRRTSNLSVPNSLTLGAPGMPTGFTAASSGGTSIDLSWTAPTQTWGSAITGYKIEVSEDGTTFTELVASQSGTTYSHTGLTTGDVRHYRVRAINTRGTGQPSTVQRAIAGAPAAPTGLTAGASRLHNIVLNWDRVPTISPPITSHIIEWSTDDTNWEVVDQPAAGNTGYYEHFSSLLTVGQTFYYRVRAVNSAGASPPSTSVSAMAISRASGAGVPTDVRASQTAAGEVTVSWTAPTDVPDAEGTTDGIAFYQVYRTANSGKLWEQLDGTISNTASSYVDDDGLTVGTTYGYRMAVQTDAFFEYDLSPPDSLTVGAPSVPTSFTATVGSGRTSIDLSWTAPTQTWGSAVTGYQIEVSTDGDTFTELVASQTGTTYSHTGLSAGDVRHYRVRAINARGTGQPAGQSITIGTPPGAPTISQISSMQYQYVYIGIGVPTSAGSTPITSYTVEWSTDNSTWEVLATGVPAAVVPRYDHYSRLLTPGETFYYRVSAVNSAGAGPASVARNVTAKAFTSTGVPTGVNVSQASSTEVTVSWTAPTDLSSDPVQLFEVYRTANSGDSWRALSTTLSATTLTYTDSDGLTAGTTYSYRVGVYTRGFVLRDPSIPASLTFGAPAAPTSLTSTPAATSIALSWTAPTQTWGSAITGYKIEVSEDGTTFTELVASQTGTTYTHTGLSAGDTRWYRVRTINARGAGAASSVLQASVTVPAAPTSLRVTTTAFHAITLQWDTSPATSLGGAAFKKHILEWSTDNSSWEVLAEPTNNTDSPAERHVSSLLTPGEEFYYRIKVVNADDVESPPSAVVTVTAVARSGTGIPTGVTATKNTGTSIDVAWVAPTDLPSGRTVMNYYVFRSNNDGDSWTLDSQVGASTLMITDTGLDTNTCYGYRVYMEDDEFEDSALSDEAYATTGTVAVPAAPTGLTATSDGTSTFNLAWTAPAVSDKCSVITGYEIEQSTDGGSNWTEVEDDTMDDGVTYAHTSQTLTTVRQYRVGAINSAGTGTWSNVVTAGMNTVPGPPGNLSATANGRTAITLSWDAPTNTGGADITGYRVQWSADQGSSWSDVDPAHTGTTRTYSHTGRSPNTRYDYQVYASNSQGESATASSSTSATTEAIMAPDAPTAVSVTPSGRTILIVSWTAPADNGGEAITGYKIDVSTDGGTNYNPLVTNTRSTQTTYIHRGLSAGVTRHYQISAINSVNTGAASTAGMGTTVDGSTNTVPSDPTSLTATASGRTLIVLTWTAPSNNGGSAVSGYKIEWSADGTSNWAELEDDTESTATTFIDRGLSAGSTRHYRVSAINTTNTGTASITASATTVDGSTNTIPSDPTGLSASANGPTTIVLSWTAPANTGGTAITGYHIEWSSDGTAGWADVMDDTESTSTTYSDTGLLGGATRHYRVYAINAQGESLPSNTDDATTAAAVRPGAPQNLVATASGRATINLTWNLPTSDGGARITSYRVQWSADGNAPWTNVTPAHSGTDRTYSDTGLDPSTTRHYRVYASNSVGESTSASATDDATTAAVTATRPGPPGNLSATANGRTAITLSWDAPTNTGGADITGYRVQWSADQGSSWSDVDPAHTGTTRTYSHTGRSPNTRYDYQVYASNSQGESATASSSTSATTEATMAPDAPTAVSVTPSGRTILIVSWTAPADNGGEAITGYKIDVSTDGGTNYNPLVTNTRSTQTTYIHRGLSAGVTRHYQISAINSVNTGAASTAGMGTTVDGSTNTVPSDPTSLTATASGHTLIVLMWTAPSNNGGSAVSGYKIEWSADGTSNWAELEDDTESTATTFIDRGLSAGSTRHYRVSAINTTNTGTASITASATTVDGSTNTIPSDPTGLNASANGPTTIDLSWTVPANTGGTAITGYHIEWSSDGTAGWADVMDDTESTSTTYSDTGLLGGATRHYRVYAINAQGESLPSNTDDATTAAAVRPGAPQNLVATASGRATINLTWNLPTSDGGARITSYRVQWSADGNAPWTNVTPAHSGTDRTYSDTGLDPSTTRHYRVYASNSVGESTSASATDDATTAAVTATRPGPPGNLSATANGRTAIDLTWDAPTNTGGADITGYRIQWSADGNAPWTNVSPAHTGTDRTYSDTGLNPSTTRHYRVYVSNSVGESTSASTPANATTDAIMAPDAPTAVSVTPSGRTILVVSWTAPTDNGGAAIIGYRIEVSTDGGRSYTELVGNSGSSQTIHIHRGLSPGVTRHYRIGAINAQGTGMVSNVDDGTTVDRATPAIPSDPLELTATSTLPVVLSWRAPADNGGEAITGYQVQWSADGQPPWTPLGERQTSTTYTDHHSDRHYRVSAINRVGESLPSNVVTRAATQPQVRFTRASARIDETAGTYQVQVTGRPSVSYTLSGTATQDADYTISDNLLITIVDDVDDEPNETIIITLTGDNLGSPYVFTLTIVDNDVPNLSFTQTVSNQSYLVGVDIKDLELPEARYGTRPYSYTLTPEIPKGLKFDARTLSGTPTEVMAPTIFTYTVTDANAQSATQTFTIEVKAPPSLTFAETVGDQRYPVQIPLADHVLPAATGGVAPYVYTLMPELPVGLTFDTQTRTLSGVTSEVAEAVIYTYTAQDRIGTRTEQTFSLEIYQMAFINKSIPDQSYPRGEPIAPWVLPEVSDGVPPIAYTLTLLDFPFNLRYNAQSRTIYGTPMEVTPPVPMTYTATDQNGAQDSLKFTIEILSPTQTEANQGVPQEFRVYANYPNPFDRSTHLVFDLPWAAQVQVEVLNVLGRRVMAIPAVQLSAGWRHELELTDLDLPSGPYLYRMIATSLDDQQSSVYTGHLMRVQ